MDRGGVWRIVILLIFVGAPPPSAAEETPDFHRQVRPILSAHCFKCHGPDESTREAGLRLDERTGATKELDSGVKAVVPGEPEASELVRRIFSADESERMPPTEANKSLTDDQKRILKAWVAGGANYEEHWAFVPPRQVPPPTDGDDTGRLTPPARQAIDAFIRARLQATGLTPPADADRYTLVRRVSLDLVGLPPTPEEADAFVNDPSPDAYERLVDRLLASPHYGERWARRWLDLARYADTNGYEKDRVRSMWPYRDWVIRALNADMPFDQFTIEQLSGDMLPGATLDQRIATGFHRNTMINEEGGIDPLEFRYHAMVDRNNTTATVWLGLTLGCAQCHTHKFDPIPHADYYRQMALLNNADEPTIDVPQPDIAGRRAEIEQAIAKLETELPSRFPAEESEGGAAGPAHLEKKFAAWLDAETKRTVKWQLLKPIAATSGVPTLTIQDDGSIFASGDMTKRDVYDVTLDAAGLDGITAIRLEAMPDERLPRGGPGRIYYEGPIGDFWLSKATLSGAILKSATHSFANGKNAAAAAIDDDPQSGWSINGGQGRTHYAVFVLERPLEAAPAIDVKLLFERYYAAGLGRFRVWATTDERGGEARDFSNEVEALLLIPAEKRTPEQRQRLLAQFVQVAPELAAEREKIKKLRDSLPELPTTLVMQERPNGHPRMTFVHHRGEFLQPKAAVEAGVLSIFRPPAGGMPGDRLAFARWLVSDENPLVGRVTMNRHWAALFGTGIVRTLEDFGYQGEPPSHPELLDWLAVEFTKHRGWSLKSMHRLMVTSSAYRQSASIQSPESADPDNRLLSRFPRTRLEAELVRDAALRVAGLLTNKLGGPGVFPPQPPGITTEGAYGKLEWKVSADEDRYRRGLYTFAKRTAPYAMFATFDGPSGEACTARRDVTNTPLQALTMLNDEALVEAAQALGRDAARLAAAPTRRDSAEVARHLFRRCLTRPPTDEELRLLVEFYEAQKIRLAGGDLEAAKIAGPGEGDAVERAAWTLVARALLNLDETITKE